jgi:3-methyladenine DNA glycosylase AlkD
MNQVEYIWNQTWELKYQMLQAFCGASEAELQSMPDGHWPMAWHVLHCMNMIDFIINVHLEGEYQLEHEVVYQEWPLVTPEAEWTYPASIELQRRWVVLIDGILSKLTTISVAELQTASATAYGDEPLIENFLRVFNHTNYHLRCIVALRFLQKGTQEFPDQGIWMPKRKMVRALTGELEAGLKEVGNKQSSMVRKLAKKYLPQIAQHDMWTIIENCEDLMSTRNTWIQMIVCAWMERLGDRLERVHFFHFERWLHLYVCGWGSCDDLCKRITNPLLRKYPDLVDRVADQWTKIENTWIKRASAVSLIRSEKGRYVSDFPMKEIRRISDALIHSRERYVQKALGWLLKAASLYYKDEVVAYLRANQEQLSRLSYRYAIENIDETTKAEMKRGTI